MPRDIHSLQPIPVEAIPPGSPEPFSLINRIPILENGEPLVDLREAAKFALLTPGCLPYLREGVAHMLKTARRHLPWNVGLVISTALRTHKMQADMYWHNYHAAKEKHPNWPESTLRRMTNRYFAPPDSKAPPGHCTGGAVDLTLCDLSGRRLDMTSPYPGWDSATTATTGLTPEAAYHRRMLYDAMMIAGFSNCRDEWWHWSYGDSAWAVRVGAGEAIYGLTPPPEDHSRVPRYTYIAPRSERLIGRKPIKVR